MSAGARLRRHVRRLALVTCAVGVVAALSSGPALADPGLSSLVTGITGPLPPTLTEPVDEVGATVDPVLDPVLDHVQGQVDAAAASVDEAVDETTGLADATGSGAAGDTVDTLTGGAAPAPAVSPRDEPPAARVAPASTDEGTAPVSASSPAVDAPGATSVAAPAVLETAAVSPGATEPVALIHDDLTGASGIVATRRDPTMPAAVATTANPAWSTPSVHATTAPGGQSIAGEAAHDSGSSPARPLPQPTGDSFLFGGPLPEPPPTVPLLAALLALLALVAPLAGGRRLHPAVASLRPADVRFRLVRPG